MKKLNVKIIPLFSRDFLESRAALWMLLFFSVILIFNNLSKPGLPSNDDCVKAERAWEMIERGDYITPHLGGEPNFDHPPFFLWLIAVSFGIFGKTDFAARFPGALAALLAVWVVYEIGRRLKNRTAGWWAGCFLTTSYIYLKSARRVQTDHTFALLTGLALLFFIKVVQEALKKEKEIDYKRIWLNFLAFGLFSGLAGLTKSVFIFFPLASAFLVLLILKKTSVRIMFPYIISVFVACITMGWWYIYHFFKYKELFTQKFAVDFLLHHASGGSEMGKFGYFGYVYELIRHFWPWLPILILTIWLAIKKPAMRKDAMLKLLAVHALLPYILLTFVGDKAVRYIIFTFVPISIFMAYIFTEWLPREKLRKYAGWAVLFMMAISAFVTIRPIDYRDLSNIDYMLLGRLVEKKLIRTDNTEFYVWNEDFKKPYRALIWYTGYSLKGVLRTGEGVDRIMKNKNPVYLIINKSQFDDTFLIRFKITADLDERYLLEPRR